MDAAVDSYLPRYFAPRVYQKRPELVERIHALMQWQDARGYAQLVRGMTERLDSHDVLDDVRVPAFVIAGAEDTISKPRLRAAADAMCAKFMVFSHGGHLPVWEAPDATADALLSFAQRARG